MIASFLMLATVAALSRPAVFDPLPPEDDFANAPPAQKIAMMDARGWVAESDPLIARARAALDRVERVFFEDEERIADFTHQLWREVCSQGRRVSATEILEAAATWGEAQPERRRRFSRVAMLYARARQAGLSHAKAVEVLKEAAHGDLRRGWR